MNHLFDLIDTLERLPPLAEAVLATVVEVEGSAYRQPSARMLMLGDGQAVGMVSGGCLEQHLVQRAFWLTRDGAVLKRYQTADDFSENDEQEGFGLGCQGTITVLFERLSLAQDNALMTCFKRLKNDKQPQTLATIIASNTNSFKIGQHFTNGELTHLLSDWQLTNQRPASRKSSFIIQTYQKEHQQIQVFIETLTPPLQLIIFGAGQDCLPLVAMTTVQGWQVTVIDSRLDKIQRYQHDISASFQHVTFQHITLDNAESVQPFFTLSPQVAVVIMTHSLSQDTVWLTQALTAQSPLRYIGQLGPKYRTEELLATIETELQRSLSVEYLYYPVGLPLGGDTPEAVALSITAQIQQVFYGG